MVKVLLINPSMEELYKKAKVKSSVPKYFPLNLLTIATPLMEKNHSVRLLDLNFYTNLKEYLIKSLDDFSPDYVGITFTTPLYSQSLEIVSIIKNYKNDIIIVAGGVHITSDCMDTMKKSRIDIAVIGEGDFKLLEIIDSNNMGKIKGIAYKKEDEIIINERGQYLKDLDIIPFPSTGLIKIEDYNVPHTYCKQNPVFPLETSRGCVYGCVYCNKSIFGRTFRFKSVKRVIDDLKKIVDLGYKEVHIIDDGFTTDMNRAKQICQLIIQENIKLSFNCPNGIRADNIDLELLKLMKQAGFYRVAFGVETGSQKILDNIIKNLKIEEIVNAFELCRTVGIETTAFFMFGLPGETEEDLKTTIKFAKKLKPDIAKFDIMIPLPSTPIFEEWKLKGYITSLNWDDYGFYHEKKIYEHPDLSWDILSKYLNLAYRSFYLSPDFMMRRFTKSLKNGTFLEDAKMFFSIKW
ncbi:MAG: radical SAM protein [Candidatus Methanoperedens sp.]|nr:radical SAM protein [Candidatus Methanoperedens sp.]